MKDIRQINLLISLFHPGLKVRGYQAPAFSCLQEIENLAINHNYSAIRLDAVKINPKLLEFYEKSGYKRVGELIFYPGDKYDNAFLFEKVLGTYSILNITHYLYYSVLG